MAADSFDKHQSTQTVDIADYYEQAYAQTLSNQPVPQMQPTTRNFSGTKSICMNNRPNPSTEPTRSVNLNGSTQPGLDTKAASHATSRVPKHPTPAPNDMPTPTPLAAVLEAPTASNTMDPVPKYCSYNSLLADELLHEDSTDKSNANLNASSNMSISINDMETDSSDTVLDPCSKNNRKNSAEIEVGSIVANRYEILSEISQGGYGIVYRARQLGIDRVVALKRLRSQNDKSVLQRFLLEANIIKDLIHPNTIQLIDAGVHDNHLFIVMEYIDGISLKSLIHNEKDMTIERTIHITKQILKSLNEAHQRGIIHRDIKPSNIIIRNIIGEKDFVKVLDFGIAKARYKNMPRLTQDGKLMGTPQYLAPELIFGDAPTPAVDIFAVGLIMVEMMTKKSPLSKDPAQAIKAATSKSPIKIPQWLASSEIGPIIQCAIQKDPKLRYHSAAEMLNDLEYVSNHLIASNAKPNTSLHLNKSSFSQSTLFKLAIAAMFFVIAANILIFFMI